MVSSSPWSGREPTGKIVILIVEDDLDVLENIAEILEAEGFETRRARDGEQAYQSILAQQPDLIISDVLMPRMDGRSFLARLQQTSGLPVIPFIFLSALSDRLDFRAGMGLGADDYITKPFTRRELLDAVYRRLQRRRQIDSEAVRRQKQTEENLYHALPHEFLQPLSNIIAQAAQIEKDIRTGDAAQASLTVRSIRQTGEKMLRMVSTYMELERLIQAEVEGAESPTEPANALLGSNLDDLLAGIADEYEGRKRIDFELRPAFIALDEGSLMRIVEELTRHCLDGLADGVELVVRGVPLAGLREYGLTFSADRPFLDPIQADWLASTRSLTASEFIGLGAGFALAVKLIRRYGGTIKPGEMEQGGMTLRVMLPLAVTPHPNSSSTNGGEA